MGLVCFGGLLGYFTFLWLACRVVLRFVCCNWLRGFWGVGAVFLGGFSWFASVFVDLMLVWCFVWLGCWWGVGFSCLLCLSCVLRTCSGVCVCVWCWLIVVCCSVVWSCL